MKEEVEKYLKRRKGTPTGRKSSVLHDETRVSKAKDEARKEPITPEIIAAYVYEFLELLEMDDHEIGDRKLNGFTLPKLEITIPPSQNLKEFRKRMKEFYRQVKEGYGLESEKDIVWMKFTEDRHLGVVAGSNDINFEMKTTSGIIIEQLSKEWNESFVLVFPLRNIPEGLVRGEIERGIGNYLIEKGVPILDFYSHNYQFIRRKSTS